MATPSIPSALPSVTYVPATQIAEVQLLHRQGVSPAEIAAILGLSAAAVDGYLHIAAGSPPSVAEAPTAVHERSASPSISILA